METPESGVTRFCSLPTPLLVTPPTPHLLIADKWRHQKAPSTAPRGPIPPLGGQFELSSHSCPPIPRGQAAAWLDHPTWEVEGGGVYTACPHGHIAVLLVLQAGTLS